MTTFMTYKEECEALRQRVAELETQLAKNNPLLDEAADAIDKLTAERDALKKLYESSEESVLALKETRNRLAEERDALKQQRDDLLAALELCIPELRGWMNAHGEDIGTIAAIKAGKAAIKAGNAAIASVKEKQNAAE